MTDKPDTGPCRAFIQDSHIFIPDTYGVLCGQPGTRRSYFGEDCGVRCDDCWREYVEYRMDVETGEA